MSEKMGQAEKNPDFSHRVKDVPSPNISPDTSVLPELETKKTQKNGKFQHLRIGFASFRIAGDDGVSLEIMQAWDPYYTEHGAKTYYFAGELPRKIKQSGKGVYYGPVHFLDALHPDQRVKKSIQELQNDRWAKGDLTDDELGYLMGNIDSPKSEISEEVERLAAAKKKIKERLLTWIEKEDLNMLVIENTQSLPHNLPYALALVEAANEKSLHVMNHMHDFHFEERPWLEAERGSNKEKLYNHLIQGFKAQTPVVINSTQVKELDERGILDKRHTLIMPNLRRFDKPLVYTPLEREYIRALEAEIRGLDTHSVILGAMVRPVKRKYLRLGVRLAIEVNKNLRQEVEKALAREASDTDGSSNKENERLWALVGGRCRPEDVKVKYYVPHLMMRSDEDPAYPRRIQQFAEDQSQIEGVDVEVVYAEEKNRAYSVPLHVHYGAIKHNLYTSKGEGWGNGYLEGLLYGVDQTRNRYPVMISDIEGKGEEVISIDGRKNDGPEERARENQQIHDAALEITRWLLQTPEQKNQRKRKNFEVGRRYFNLDQLDRVRVPPSPVTA